MLNRSVQLQWQNVCSALRLRARMSKAISLGLVTISLISLSLVSTPAGVSAGAGIIPPIPSPGQISQGPNCPTSYKPSDYPRYIDSKVFKDSWTSASVVGINNQGQVLGNYSDGGKQIGFVRNVGGPVATFSAAGGDSLYATGINDLGQFVGVVQGMEDGFFPDLRGGTLKAYVPVAMNNLGQTVGSHFYTNFGWDPEPGLSGFGDIGHETGFLRDANGHLIDFGESFIPKAINNLGQVVGEEWWVDNGFLTGVTTAYLTGFVRDADGTRTEIRLDIPGHVPGHSTHLVGINDLGQIAGWYHDYPGTGRVRGFVRDANGHVTYVDVGSGLNTRPIGVNNLGQVTGVYWDSASPSSVRGFVLDNPFSPSANGFIAKFVPTLATGTVGINDLGQVLGHYDVGGHTYGFVTGPVFVEPFASFSVTRADIAPSSGAITVFGSFTLCGGRILNPVENPVLVKLYRTGAAPAWASIAIPWGSLQLSAGRYVYQGVLHGVPVTVNLYPHSDGSWDFAVYAAGVSGLPSTNPVTVLLAIGDNTAAATVTATIH
jgi:hypothetical protein